MICVQNVGSGNGVDMGRKLKQMTDMGQNAMQNTFEVRAGPPHSPPPPFGKVEMLLRVTLAIQCSNTVMHLCLVSDMLFNILQLCASAPCCLRPCDGPAECWIRQWG